MRRWAVRFLVLLLLVACGRIAFDPQATADGDGGTDTDGASGWWDPAFGRRMKLVIDRATLANDLVGFTVLVKLDPNRIDYGATQPAGQDLRFVDADQTTLLAYDIERFSPGGTSYVWVHVPVIEAPADYIWLYFGNAAAPAASNPTGTWPGYAVVWHLDEDPGTSIRDRSANSNHGTMAGNPPTTAQAAGQIGGSLELDGNNDWVTAPTAASLVLTGDITAQVWMRRADAAERWLCDFAVPDSEQQSSNHIYELSVDNDNTMTFEWEQGGGNDVATKSTTLGSGLGVWSLVGVTRDATSLEVTFYENGAPLAEVQYATNASGGDLGALWLGGQPSTTSSKQPFLGRLDELRIAPVVRSPEWMATEYRSMTDTLITYGAEERF